MFIETQFYDNGKAFAKIVSKHRPDGHTEGFDYYVEEVEDLQEWIEDNLIIELDDIVPLVLALDAGSAVEITQYI